MNLPNPPKCLEPEKIEELQAMAEAMDGTGSTSVICEADELLGLIDELRYRRAEVNRYKTINQRLDSALQRICKATGINLGEDMGGASGAAAALASRIEQLVKIQQRITADILEPLDKLMLQVEQARQRAFDDETESVKGLALKVKEILTRAEQRHGNVHEALDDARRSRLSIAAHLEDIKKLLKK